MENKAKAYISYLNQDTVEVLGIITAEDKDIVTFTADNPKNVQEINIVKE